jgi:hypothetical protein
MGKDKERGFQLLAGYPAGKNRIFFSFLTYRKLLSDYNFVCEGIRARNFAKFILTALFEAFVKDIYNSRN